MGGCFLIIFYIATIAAEEQNCSEHEIRNHTENWHKYAIDDALDQVDRNKHDVERITEDLETFFKENAVFDSCISEEEVTKLIDMKFKNIKADSRRILLITCIITSVGMIFSFVAILHAISIHRKLRKVRNELHHSASTMAKNETNNEHILPGIAMHDQDFASSRADLLTDSL